MLPEEIRDNRSIANSDRQLQQHTNTPRKHGYGILDDLDYGAVGRDYPRYKNDVQSVGRESESRSEIGDRINMRKAFFPSDAVHANENEVVANLYTRRDRVSEYEACSRGTQVQKLGDGQGKGKNIGGGYSPIVGFPNEVLTHIFSFLDPTSLFALSLVSRQFHELLENPHTWRGAFVRYFPDQLGSISSTLPEGTTLQCPRESSFAGKKRYFTRLTVQSTWRKEYVLRTALLGSLSRGKAHVPQHVQSKQSKSANAGTIITYPGCTGGSNVTHIAATFPPISRGPKSIQNGQMVAPLRPHLMHGSSDTGTVASSDPTTGRIDKKTVIGTPLQPSQFISWPIPGLANHRPGIELGSSLMDVSDELGWCVGETVPGGRVYVEPRALATTLTRGYFLSSQGHISPPNGQAYISSVWVAKRKSKGIFEYTGGRCGLLVGESIGRLTMYSLPMTLKEWGASPSWTDAIQSWLICPGVPILSIKVDEDYSFKRQQRFRRSNKGLVIAVVNALGEVYYLRDFATGPWRLIEQTQRLVDFISEEDKMQLETEHGMVNLHWERVRRLWKGWGMDYFVEVDFAGQIVVLGKRGSSYQGSVTGERDPLQPGGGWIKCFHLKNNGRSRVGDDSAGLLLDVLPHHCKTEPRPAAPSVLRLVGESASQSPSTELEGFVVSEEYDQQSETTEGEAMFENHNIRDEWVFKDLSFSHERHSHKALEITAFAIDKSYVALLSPDEDSLGRNEHEIPGLDARLFTVGTCTGSVFVWNVRSLPGNAHAEDPVRIIHTDSPIITTVGITSLYLIHGGSDGLVQCWDPLASRVDPIRTIHSRFSSRARRRITQAELIRPNIGLDSNEYAARAVQLDPDPTVLRGAIALGTHIRYWSFAGGLSSVTHGKRRTNQVHRTGVGPPGRNREAEDIISSEILELEREKERKKDLEKLHEKFGIPGFGATELGEEELMAYARILSEEAFKKEKANLVDGGNGGMHRDAVNSVTSIQDEEEAALAAALAASTLEVSQERAKEEVAQVSPLPSLSSMASVSESEKEEVTGKMDPELAEAIRCSLLDITPGAGISFRYSYDDESNNTTPSGASTAVPFYEGCPNDRTEPGRYTNLITREEITPPGSSWGRAAAANTKVTNWGSAKSRAYVSEWPSPRQAALMPGERWGEDGEEVDEDLELAIRLSLAEEEGRRFAGSSQGGGVGVCWVTETGM